MKKHVICLILIAYTYTLTAQIKMLDANYKSETQKLFVKAEVGKFDSTANIEIMDINRKRNLNYLGQKIFFVPTKSKFFALRKHGFEEKVNPFVEIKSGIYTINDIFYSKRMQKDINIPYDNSPIPKIDEYSNKTKIYFDGQDDFNRYGGPYIEVVSELNDSLYFSSGCFNAIMSVGFFDAVKRSYEGKDFICTYDLVIQDALSKENVQLKSGDHFKCNTIAVDLVRGKASIIAVLENLNGKFAYEIQSLFPKNLLIIDGVRRVEDIKREKEIAEMSEQMRVQQMKLEQKLANEKKQKFLKSCILKYGEENGTNIAEGKVSIGMNTDMCKESWGNPLDLKRTITDNGKTEVWIYNYRSKLHFKDDILSTD